VPKYVTNRYTDIYNRFTRNGLGWKLFQFIQEVYDCGQGRGRWETIFPHECWKIKSDQELGSVIENINFKPRKLAEQP